MNKTEQAKQIASLTEKLVMSITQAIREHVGISKENAEVFGTKILYNDIFDVVLGAFRAAESIMDKEEKENGNE